MMNKPELLIGLNPDLAERKRIVRLIKANKGYCISQPGRTEKTKCHCKHFKDTGMCLCGLFISVPVVEVGES